jgi:hypothetical protein
MNSKVSALRNLEAAYRKQLQHVRELALHVAAELQGFHDVEAFIPATDDGRFFAAVRIADAYVPLVRRIPRPDTEASLDDILGVVEGNRSKYAEATVALVVRRLNVVAPDGHMHRYEFDDGQWVVYRRPIGSQQQSTRFGVVVDGPDGPEIKLL